MRETRPAVRPTAGLKKTFALPVGSRFCSLQRFPYSVIHEIEDAHSILILSVFHQHRKPLSWRQKQQRDPESRLQNQLEGSEEVLEKTDAELQRAQKQEESQCLYKQQLLPVIQLSARPIEQIGMPACDLSFLLSRRVRFCLGTMAL